MSSNIQQVYMYTVAQYISNINFGYLSILYIERTNRQIKTNISNFITQYDRRVVDLNELKKKPFDNSKIYITYNKNELIKFVLQEKFYIPIYIHKAEAISSFFNNVLLEIVTTPLIIQDPINVINNTYYNYIENFINVFLEDNAIKNSTLFNKSFVKEYLFRNKEDIDTNVIINDIRYLKHEKILTSRLAIFIYKICTFDFNATDKFVGLFYKRALQNTSKSRNSKKYNINNVKGYDVFNLMPVEELNIRTQIAKNLLNLNYYYTQNIASATGLNIDYVEALKDGRTY